MVICPEAIRAQDSMAAYNGAINLFLKAFPGGFDDPFYVFSERTYKDDAAAFVGLQLSAERTDDLISEGDYRAIADAAQRAIQRTNIAFRFEAMALGAALKHDATMKAFVLALADMLYGDDFGAGLDAVVKALEARGAARWPLITYFPFLRHPDKHMFVKPEIVKTCAHRLGFELDYDSRPNMSTYTDVLRLTEHIRKSVSILDPRDNIDIQAFIYVVAKDGYLTDSKAARERWESAQRT